VSEPTRPKLPANRRKKRFNVHRSSIKIKILLAEIAGIISLVILLCGGIALEIRTIIRYLGL
jgi:hypothetical protein